MLTTKKARKALLKRHQKHLTDIGVRSMAAWERTRSHHRRNDITCRDCEEIEHRLQA